MPRALLELLVRQIARQRVAQLALEQLGPEPPLALGPRRDLVAEAATELVDGGVCSGRSLRSAAAIARSSAVAPGLASSTFGLGHALVDEVVDPAQLGQGRLCVKERDRAAGQAGQRADAASRYSPKPSIRAKEGRAAVLPRAVVARQDVEEAGAGAVDVAERVPLSVAAAPPPGTRPNRSPPGRCRGRSPRSARAPIRAAPAGARGGGEASPAGRCGRCRSGPASGRRPRGSRPASPRWARPRTGRRAACERRGRSRFAVRAGYRASVA